MPRGFVVHDEGAACEAGQNAGCPVVAEVGGVLEGDHVVVHAADPCTQRIDAQALAERLGLPSMTVGSAFVVVEE